MNLKQLIYKRIVHAEDIGCLLAKYSGKPAVFDTEAPDDKQDGCCLLYTSPSPRD